MIQIDTDKFKKPSTLDEWVKHHCPTLPGDILIHIEETTAFREPEDLEATIRCIMTSIRQAFEDKMH